MITRYKYDKRSTAAVFVLVLELFTMKKVMLKMKIPLKERKCFCLKPTYILVI